MPSLGVGLHKQCTAGLGKCELEVLRYLKGTCMIGLKHEHKLLASHSRIIRHSMQPARSARPWKSLEFGT